MFDDDVKILIGCMLIGRVKKLEREEGRGVEQSAEGRGWKWMTIYARTERLQ